MSNLDLALKWAEEKLVAEKGKANKDNDIVSILSDMLGSREKAENLSNCLECLSLRVGDFLFKQGDEETTLYVIESGVLEVQFVNTSGKVNRLRELRPGTLVGEMAAYSTLKKRSASVVAIEPAVVYRLRIETLDSFGESALEYKAILHEMVARLLASRLDITNQRHAELS